MSLKKTFSFLFFVLIVLVVGRFIFIATGGFQGKGPATSQGPEIIPVKVMKVKLQTIQNVLEYVGNIKAQEEVSVYPKVTGKIIEKVKEEGAIVGKGDVIAYIDRDEVGLKFEKAPVESSLPGIVAKVYVDIGTSVTPQTAVAMVVDMNKVKINLDLPEKYVPQVFLNQEAEISVDAYPGKEFAGVITKISPVVDLATRTAVIKLMIDNPLHELRSGMFARVKLVLEEHKETPVILKEAVMGQEDIAYVFVVENKKALLRKVTLGMRQGPYFEVTDGIKPGDLVVVMGQQRLSDGALVEPEE